MPQEQVTEFDGIFRRRVRLELELGLSCEAGCFIHAQLSVFVCVETPRLEPQRVQRQARGGEPQCRYERSKRKTNQEVDLAKDLLQRPPLPTTVCSMFS